MTREQFRAKYESDPKFRLERLLTLKRRPYGRAYKPNAYDFEIQLAIRAIKRMEPKP